MSNSMTPAAGGGLNPELDIIIHTIISPAVVRFRGFFVRPGTISFAALFMGAITNCFFIGFSSTRAVRSGWFFCAPAGLAGTASPASQHNFHRCAIYGRGMNSFHGIVLVLLRGRAASGRCGPFCVHKRPGHIITPQPRSRPKYGVSRGNNAALNYTRAPSAIYG
jgi:hypothetical protein